MPRTLYVCLSMLSFVDVDERRGRGKRGVPLRIYCTVSLLVYFGGMWALYEQEGTD